MSDGLIQDGNQETEREAGGSDVSCVGSGKGDARVDLQVSAWSDWVDPLMAMEKTGGNWGWAER